MVPGAPASLPSLQWFFQDMEALKALEKERLRALGSEGFRVLGFRFLGFEDLGFFGYYWFRGL